MKPYVVAYAVAVALLATLAEGQFAAKVDKRAADSDRSAKLDVRIPQLIAYQGKLTDSTGRPVNDGKYVMVFSLYADSLGSSLWQETQTVETKGGLFNTLLGSSVSISIDAVPQGGCYLGMRVLPSAQEFHRQKIVSVPFAFQAGNSDKLQGKNIATLVDSLDTLYVNEGQTNSVTSAMIADAAVTTVKIKDSTIARADVAPDFKAPYADSAVHADTADYAQMASDSARVAANAYLLQGKDTIALWNAKTLQGKDSTGFVNAGQVSSVTSAMITDAAVTTVKIKDSTIARADVAPDFKAPYADSAVHADTADYAQMASDSARVAANAYLLQGKDTTALNASYVNKGQPNSITGAMITDGQVSSADIRDTTVNTTKLKDNAVISAKIADLNVTQAKIAANAVNTTKVERNANSGYVLTSNGGSSDPSWQAVPAVPNHLGDITGPHSATVIAANAVNSGKIADGTVTSADVRDTTVNTAQLKDAAVTAPKLNQMGAGTGQVMKWAGSAWAPRNDSTIPSGNAGGGLTGTYPNPTIAGDAVSSANIVDGSVTSADIRDTTVTLGKIARGSTSGKAIIARGTDSDPAWGYPAAVGDSGTRVAFIKTGTFNFNLGTIPRNSVCDTFVAISGLRPNDRVFLSHPITGNGSAWPHIQGLGSSEVTGDDTLRFRVWNSDPDTDWNPTLNTWRYIWIRQ